MKILKYYYTLGQALIINDLLTMSSMKPNRHETDCTPQNLNNFLHHLKNLVSIEVEKKSLAFEININQEVPDVLLLDEIPLRHVLLNLLSNAIKFTHNGSLKISIFSTNTITSDNILDLHICVEDTGVGIQKDFVGQLFDEFKQQDGSSTREFGGLGIGLSVAKRLVDLMGGNITVKSEINKGSIFEVVLYKIKISDKAIIAELAIDDNKQNVNAQINSGQKEDEKQSGDMEVLLKLLKELETHVNRKKPVECKELMGRIEEFKWPDDVNKDVLSISKFILRYNFKDAASILGPLLEKIQR